MAKKMYYTQEETLEKLGVDEATLQQKVDDGELRVFMDGAKKMYKADQVDELAGGSEGGEALEEIELAPASPGDDTSALGEDVINLADETDAPSLGGDSKEDTVITSEGISIFDEEDLDIETADPMAKTQIAPSLEDQISIEGVGSGSGLLDLTRESDDTSLGAELLAGIDMEEPSPGPVVGEETAAPIEQDISFVQPAAEAVEYVEEREVIDRNAGLFEGLMVAVLVIMLINGAVALTVMRGVLPSFVVGLHKNLMIVVLGELVVAGVVGLIGWVLGRSAADRKLAVMQHG